MNASSFRSRDLLGNLLNLWRIFLLLILNAKQSQTSTIATSEQLYFEKVNYSWNGIPNGKWARVTKKLATFWGKSC